MAYLNDLLRKLEAFDTAELDADVAADTQEDLVELQKEQMLHGLNSRGEIIGLYRQESYARFKHAMNPLPGYGVVDLKRTGIFQDRIVAHLIGDEIIIESTDEKSRGLENKYGPIFGLSAEYAQRHVRETVRPAFNRRVSQLIGLSFLR